MIIESTYHPLNGSLTARLQGTNVSFVVRNLPYRAAASSSRIRSAHDHAVDNLLAKLGDESSEYDLVSVKGDSCLWSPSVADPTGLI